MHTTRCKRKYNLTQNNIKILKIPKTKKRKLTDFILEAKVSSEGTQGEPNLIGWTDVLQSFPHIVDTPTECHGRPETTTNNSVRVSLRVRPGGPWVSILQSAQEIASGGILRPSSFYSCSLLWNFYFFTWEFGAEPQPCSSVGYGCALQDGVLQAGDQQNRVGGTGAVSRLEAGRNGSIWDCVVSYASCSWKF